jgi:formylglycine-generating enzyme required for sulfatase activity
MGSPSNEEGHTSGEVLHEVTLTQGFWLSTYEITQAQWEDIMGDNPSSFPGDFRPVDTVSWNDVQEFIVTLNAVTAGAPYRLPTEAEWEYAYRAATLARFYWGADSDETEIGDYAWYDFNGGSRSHAVGEKIPNAWGFCDMSGNAYEWCQDYIGDYPAGPVTNPQGPNTGTDRVLRGGSWKATPNGCRAAHRNNATPLFAGEDYGFRLLRTAN